MGCILLGKIPMTNSRKRWAKWLVVG